MRARADPGTAHPTPKGAWGTLRLPECCLQAFPISSQQSGDPEPPGCAAWPCHLCPPQPVGSRGTEPSYSKALSSLPAFPLLLLLEQPGELQARSVTFSRSLSLLSLLTPRAVLLCWGVQEAPGSGQRQCQDGPGWDVCWSSTPATSLLQLKGPKHNLHECDTSQARSSWLQDAAAPSSPGQAHLSHSNWENGLAAVLTALTYS